MRIRLSRVGGALAAAALLLTAGPVFANPLESQENSLQSQFARVAAQLMADSERAIAAAAEAANGAVEEGQDALAEAEKNLAPRLQTFSRLLNEQKVKFAMIGEDAGAWFDAWKQAITESWTDAWAESWSETWVEMQRSASQALDEFRDWIEKYSVSEKTEIPV